MSRMIDKILDQSVLYIPDWMDDASAKRIESHSQEMANSLSDAEVLLIDNVAEYFTTNDKERWDILNDFPNLAPPYPVFWMEYRYPKRVRHHGKIVDTDNSEIERVGILFIGNKDEDSLGWKMSALLFVEIERVIQGPWTIYTIPTDAVGRITDTLHYAKWCSGDTPLDMQETLHAVMGNMISPALLAISFLHCKNVTVEPNYPPTALNKSYQKKHGRPMLKYYTLNIQPMKEILKHEGKSETTGLKHALHICRGHFKDYRDKGLFGRNKGLYWWDSHVRGTVEQGVVVKDYNVKQPGAVL